MFTYHHVEDIFVILVTLKKQFHATFTKKNANLLEFPRNFRAPLEGRTFCRRFALIKKVSRAFLRISNLPRLIEANYYHSALDNVTICVRYFSSFADISQRPSLFFSRATYSTRQGVYVTNANAGNVNFHPNHEWTLADMPPQNVRRHTL